MMPYFQALKIAGSLSTPSKMPCPAYGLPAAKCKAGAKLTGVACGERRVFALEELLLRGCLITNEPEVSIVQN